MFGVEQVFGARQGVHGFSGSQAALETLAGRGLEEPGKIITVGHVPIGGNVEHGLRCGRGGPQPAEPFCQPIHWVACTRVLPTLTSFFFLTVSDFVLGVKARSTAQPMAAPFPSTIALSN